MIFFPSYSFMQQIYDTCVKKYGEWSEGILLQQQTMNTNDSDGHLENHAWNQVCINNKWYNVDATWDDPDFGTSVLSHRFFNVSDEILRADHEWHEEKAEKCSDMDWNYFEKKNLYAKNPEARQTVIKQMAAGHPYGYLECAFSGADLSEDEIGVLFSLSGISKLSYVISGEGQYKLLQVLIN